MKVWVLSGFSQDMGLWDTEVFTTEENALDALRDYAEEYEGEVQGLNMFSDEAHVRIESHEVPRVSSN